MTTPEQIVDFQLAQGMTPREILLAHYQVVRTASDQDCYTMLAGAKASFFSDVAAQAKLKLTDVIMLFKDSRVVKLFSAIGWSFKKLYGLLKTGYKVLKDLPGFTLPLHHRLEFTKKCVHEHAGEKQWKPWRSTLAIKPGLPASE